MEANRFAWVGFSVFSLAFGMAAGFFAGQHGRHDESFSPTMTIISNEASALMLDALQTQADARARDGKLDAGQQETIRLLVKPKIKELSTKGIADSDLTALAAIYSLIEQPNGLRATQSGVRIPAGTLLRSTDGGKTVGIVGTTK